MKLLILGNGFDLAHGLPTRYIDFLEFSEKVLAIYDNEDDYTSDSYKKLLKKWKADKLKIKTIKDKLENIFAKRNFNSHLEKTSECYVTTNAKLDDFYKKLKKNVLYLYFTKLYHDDQISGDSWINFESEISEIIRAIDNNHISLRQTVFVLNNYLLKGADVFLTLKLDKFTSSYSSIYGEDLGTVSDLRKRLYSDLENLIYAFEIYLSEFVKLNKIVPLSSIRDIKPDHVITFNYTKTYERVYRPKVEVCHIHGTCDLHNLVLGIDEYLGKEEQSKRTDFAIFKKFIQRIRNRNDNFYTSWIKEIEGEDIDQPESPEISDIYIYGHSLDITDKDILRPFLKSQYTNIHIYAHDKIAEGNLISNLLRIIGEKTVIEKASLNPPMLDFTVLSEVK